MAQFKWDWGAEVVEGSADPGLQALSSFTLSLKQARSDVSTLGEDLGEIPDEFLDPITQELMQVCPRVVHNESHRQHEPSRTSPLVRVNAGPSHSADISGVHGP